MKWMHTVWRWGSLSLSVAALSGLAFVGKQWAERHALEAVLGSGASADSLTVHWSHSAGCAENVCIPLTAPNVSRSDTRLSARRMWFTYDLPALMRKRIVLPRMVIEDAHIVATVNESHLHGSPAAAANSQPQSLEWVEQLQRQIALLETEQFVTGTQVAIDAAMLSEQWRAKFVDVHNRARRILVEAKDIQQQLAALDNPLRHEARVIASRERLEALKTELAGLKNSLLRTDKTLREQQSRIRETLLIEKRSLREAGTAYRAQPASELAELALAKWLEACVHEPTQYSVLLTDLICTPFRSAPNARGSDILHVDALSSQFAVGSAKIAGDISLPGNGAMPPQRAPFTASGAFQVRAWTDSASTSQAGERARWQMSVGRNMNCISLEGTARSARARTASIQLESSAAGHLEADCEVIDRSVAGSGQVRLREWLSEGSHESLIHKCVGNDPLVQELLAEAVANLEPAPEAIAFAFANRAGKAHVELDVADSEWLAEELARAASKHVAGKYEAAVERLETRILAELEATNRAVAISYNEESQHLQQLLQELKMLQADVMNNLAQRAGTEFARKSAADTLR